MSYKWPGIPNGDYSFDHGRAVWNKIINYLRRLSEKLDADIVDATVDRRGMMTAADKAALDAVPDTYVRKDGDTVTGSIYNIYTNEYGQPVNHFWGRMAANDFWALRAGGEVRLDPQSGQQRGPEDSGYLEIATADNGTEPIYVSQYLGAHTEDGELFQTRVRRATLLDENGVTRFPVRVVAPVFEGAATKLGTVDVGSATQPIYLDDGVATACTYQLHKTVPADAVFTDTVYTHPTYTACTGKPTADQTPAFGDAVTISQIVTDATGHVTAANDRTITVPATEASQSSAGLMSAADKAKLDGITPSDYVQKTGDTMTGMLASTGFIGPLTGNVTGNVSGSAGYLKASNINYKNIDTDFNTTYVIGLSNSDHGTRPETSWTNVLNLDSAHFQSQLAVANISSTGAVAPQFYIRAKYMSGAWSNWVHLANDSIATTSINGLMSAADKATLDGIASTYLPLSGGTLTGPIETTQNVLGKRNATSGVLRILGGTDLTNGASLTLFGKDEASAGKFLLRAYGNYDLTGGGQGALTWKGYDISPVKYIDLQAVNVIFELENKLQIIAYSVSGIANGDTVTFPRAFGATPVVLCGHPGTALVGAQAHTTSTTGFKVAHSYGSTLTIRYIAIGKGI